jgi:hypothetical protein
MTGFAPPAAAAPPVGFQPEVGVENPTRLDWQFAVRDFGRDAAKLPAAYESKQQRYQLYVPRSYDDSKLWPLVVFISPGDDPLGWRFWQKPCEDLGMLFCAAYAAGNNCPAGQRIRIVLDVLDDVRRHYRVDPDQTYLTGFSGGGRMACTIAFALPEYFGGVLPVCGTNPLNRLDYLRQRTRDRLSVAFLTGATDFNRKENEEYMHPLMQALGVRARLWVAPKLGHGIPGPDVLAEAVGWLKDDLPRRRADARERAALAADPQEVPTPLRQALRLVETAQAELQTPERTWRGVAMLQGVQARWPGTQASEKARELLDTIQADPRQAARVAEQGGAEERRTLTAQAEALERFGERQRALEAWQLLAEQHPTAAEGLKAAQEARRLRRLLAATPYLGVAFGGNSARVSEVVPKGPADVAGIEAGDVVVRLGRTKIAAGQDVRRALAGHTPGERVEVELRRGVQVLTVNVVIGSVPTN